MRLPIRSLILLSALLLCLLFTTTPTPPVQAGYADQPSPLPEWTHANAYGAGAPAHDTSARHGINLTLIAS